MRLSDLNKLRFAFGLSPDQSRIVLLLYKEDRPMSIAEINKALPCGKMGRYMKRGDGVIRTQLCNIKDKVGDHFVHRDADHRVSLTSPARARVRETLASESKIVLKVA